MEIWDIVPGLDEERFCEWIWDIVPGIGEERLRNIVPGAGPAMFREWR